MCRSAVFFSFCLFWVQISALQADTCFIPEIDPTNLTIVHDKTSDSESDDGKGGEQEPEPEPEPEPDCD